MYVKKRVTPQIIWLFSCWNVVGFTLLSVTAYCLYVYANFKILAIPFLPVATVGTAVAFYVGFKNNASYDRLWEARKIWSEIEHLSRFWAMLLTQARVKDADGVEQNFSICRTLVYRQIAWVNCLRFELRNDSALIDVNVRDTTQVRLVSTLMEEQANELDKIICNYASDSEFKEIIAARNIASSILTKQVSDLNILRNLGLGDEEYSKLLDTISECSKQQSSAERLNRFPFPRQYGHFSELFVYIFIVLLPFSLLNELAKNDPTMLWLTIPMSVLLSWVFYTMEKVGDTSENPFDNGLNDVPLTAICRDIEIELRALLGETELPSRLEAHEGVLM